MNACDDLALLEKLLAVQSIDQVYLSSGYFNLYKKLTELLKNKELSVFTSSPMANSFYNGGAIKGHIPYMYRQYLREAMQVMPNAKFYEFYKDGWSFHSKGLWLKEDGKITLTTIGSSNYSGKIKRL